jgi:saccharopine dehydrogenase-like NADP-dependent oxidoreductase
MDSWTLNQEDKDMIVMYHKFGYEMNGKKYQIDATMVTIGEDQTYTAMAKTVGLPVAIATLAILNGKIKTPGVQIPIRKEVYTPILKELAQFGISFKEKKVPYLGYNPLNI